MTISEKLRRRDVLKLAGATAVLSAAGAPPASGASRTPRISTEGAGLGFLAVEGELFHDLVVL